MKRTDIDFLVSELKRKITACNDRIEDFKKNEGFDPLTALTGTESKAQKLYGVDVNFLWELNDLIEKHDTEVKKAIFN